MVDRLRSRPGGAEAAPVVCRRCSGSLWGVTLPVRDFQLVSAGCRPKRPAPGATTGDPAGRRYAVAPLVLSVLQPHASSWHCSQSLVWMASCLVDTTLPCPTRLFNRRRFSARVRPAAGRGSCLRKRRSGQIAGCSAPHSHMEACTGQIRPPAGGSPHPCSSLCPGQRLILSGEFGDWCAWRESNPRSLLGRQEHYHYATGACSALDGVCSIRRQVLHQDVWPDGVLHQAQVLMEYLPSVAAEPKRIVQLCWAHLVPPQRRLSSAESQNEPIAAITIQCSVQHTGRRWLAMKLGVLS